MKPTQVNGRPEAGAEVEATLKLVAGLAAPEGLSERMKAGLRTAAPAKGRVLPWPAVQPASRGGWMRIAAAAALLAVMAGAGWNAYRWVTPAPEARTAPATVRPAVQGGFSAAGAMRTPQTLVGPTALVEAATTPEKKTTGKNAKRGHGAKIGAPVVETPRN